MVQFGELLKTWSLLSNSVTRLVVFNRTKIGGKCQNSRHNSNATFWVIFKQCELCRCPFLYFIKNTVTMLTTTVMIGTTIVDPMLLSGSKLALQLSSPQRHTVPVICKKERKSRIFFHFLIFKKLTPSSTTSIHPVAWYSIDQHFLKYLFVSCPSPEKIRQSEHGVWKSQKSLIQDCEQSKLRLHFEWI